MTLYVGMTLAEVEAIVALMALEESGWNASAAARMLDLARPAVYHYAHRLGIDIASRAVCPDGLAARGLARKELPPQIRQRPPAVSVWVQPDKPHKPCAICHQTDQIESTGHPKLWLCMRPDCIYQRATRRAADEAPRARAIA